LARDGGPLRLTRATEGRQAHRRPATPGAIVAAKTKGTA
jgi:hypothetical protein